MSLIIKICGLKTQTTVAAALEAGADMVGLVFFPPSPRNIDLQTAATLAGQARGKAEIVALTVNGDDALFDAITEKIRPDWLQLHGKEPPDRVRLLKARYGLPVMKAFGISTAEDIQSTMVYAGIADRFLFDAKAPKEATRPGGLGTRFDWSLLNRLDPDMPFMLSGGLDAGNVADAVLETVALGLDVSSGVEKAPGVKDPAKIREFAQAARRAQAAKADAETTA